MTDATHTLARLYRPTDPTALPKLYASLIPEQNLVLVRSDIWANRDENITKVLQGLNGDWRITGHAMSAEERHDDMMLRYPNTMAHLADH